MHPFSIQPGHRYPVGATASSDGTNFCVFSRHARRLYLHLYEQPGDLVPFQIIELDPETNRTFFFWHVFVKGLTGTEKIAYTWRAEGLNNPAIGYRFDPDIELLDPWARATTDVLWKRPYNREAKSKQTGPSMRALALAENNYDW